MKLQQPSYCWLKKRSKSGKPQNLRKTLRGFCRRCSRSFLLPRQLPLLLLPRQLPKETGLRKKRDWGEKPMKKLKLSEKESMLRTKHNKN
jgi:hypothetical protein